MVRLFDITWNDYIVTANCIGDDKKKFNITVDCRTKTIVENGKLREIDYWEDGTYVYHAYTHLIWMYEQKIFDKKESYNSWY